MIWTYSIDRGLPVDVIYIDFENAFDKLQHSILLDKLERIGVRGQLLSWFVSYLSNRMTSGKVSTVHFWMI